jgi:glycerol-3-phosphate acyltransferase PlsY
MEGISVILEAMSLQTAALTLIVTALLSYFLGNCNGAILISKIFLHDDVRKHGSGNGGLTNFQRTYGGNKLTLMVIATDMLKMVAAVALSWAIFTVVMPLEKPPLFVKYWAGMFCVLGHVFPCTLHFHGGKGILAGGTLALLVDWRVAVFAWGFFFLGVVLTRWVSLGSILAATAFGVSSAIFHPTPSIAVPALLAAGLIDWKHRANLLRLLRGQEPKLSLRKKAEP